MIQISRPLICFDLETTGVNPATDRIVQLAAIKLMPDGTRIEKEALINPGMSIPVAARDVHGISDVMVEGACTFRQFSKALFRFFSGADLAGYNVRNFDVPLLSMEFARCGIQWPEPDTAIVDAFSILLKKEERELSWALRYYTGQEHTLAHDAMADTKAALDVITAQSERYEQYTVEGLEQLAHDPNSIDLQGKFRKNEDGEVVVTFGKHKDRIISKVPRDYLEWMLDQDFMPDTKKVIEDFLSCNRQIKQAKAI